MKHLTGIVAPRDVASTEKQSTVRVERRVAECLRQVQSIGGYRTPSELLEAMLICFVRHELPNCELQFAEDDEISERRSGEERRVNQRSLPPGVERRKNRRRKSA